jgi:hypothetical protein
MFKILILSIITFIIVIIIFLLFMSFMNSDIINNNFKKIENFAPDINKNISISGTGNTIYLASDDLNYNYAYFANSGTLKINSNLICDLLIIGGGGGGGFDGGGGGGGGQVLYYTDLNVSFKSGNAVNLNIGTYDISIGNGGSYGTNITTNATNGGTTTISNSSFKLTAVGGGGGASRNNLANNGSIAGAGGAGHAASDKNSYSTSTYYGGRGGKSHPNSFGGGGGGGGANISGNLKDGKDANAISGQYAGNGGDGVNINITGKIIGYGGGGGGGSWYGAGGFGTHGGGNGNITNNTTQAREGIANTGGGGGSGGNAGVGDPNGKNGGSGVVIIRFKNIINNSYLLAKDNNGNNIIPTAWYKFEDNINIGKDEFNTYNLTNNNSVTTTTGIKGINACSFNTANYLSTTNGINLTGNNFSISYWQYAKSNTNGFSASFGTDNVMNGSIMVGYGINYNNKYFFGFWGNDYYSPEFPNDLNNWIFITFTYNVSTRTRKFYRNGIFVGSDIATNQLSQSGTRILIGKYGNGYNANGNCADFRIYNGIELIPSQISDLYNIDDVNNGDVDTPIPLTEDQEFTSNLNEYFYVPIFNSDYIIKDVKKDGLLTSTTNTKNLDSRDPFYKVIKNEDREYINRGNYIVIMLDNDYILKKYTFVVNNVNKAPSSWIIYGISMNDGKLIVLENGSAIREDYDIKTNKSDKTCIKFLLNNNIPATLYLIVFKTNFEGTNDIDITRVILEEGKSKDKETSTGSGIQQKSNNNY